MIVVESVINDLVGYKNLKIVQCNEYFNFSLDSILLPNFVSIKKETKNIVDFGCGNAPIPLILSTRTKAKIFGVEIQKEIYTLGLKTVKLNKLEKQITLYNEDIKNSEKIFGNETIDIVLSNPPYFKVTEKSNLNQNIVKTNARHETLITLEDIIKISQKILINKGILSLVHRTERLVEILDLMKKHNLEPKRIQFVFPKKDLESNLVLIEAVKNANPGLKVLKPFIIHTKNNTYTKEVLKYFH